MDDELLCNFKKCRKPLNSQAWVTSCSHIFCDEDGTREFEKAFQCPACNISSAFENFFYFANFDLKNQTFSGSTSLTGKHDIVKVDLNPSEQYKSMVLAGQRPEVIFEVCSRAVAFWTYQIHQEIMFQKYVATKTKQTSTQLDKYYQDALQRAKNEIISLKQHQDGTQKELERFQQKTAELSEKLTERIRQYQKLQTLYEALKRKCISPSYFERQVHEGKLQAKANAPFIMSTASEILHPQTQRSKRTSYSEVEKEFVLRPVHTPTEDIRVEPEFPHMSSATHMHGAQDRRNIPPKNRKLN